MGAKRRTDWAAEWREVCQRIRPEGVRSPHLPELYKMARRFGQYLLRDFHRLQDERLDLIHDLLAEKLAEILTADSPSALFATALKRRAITLDRKRHREESLDTAAADEDEDAGSGRQPATPMPDEDEIIQSIDRHRHLATLSDRDRQIVIAVACGEDREMLARTFGISRAAIDQVVSRVRRSAP